MSRVLLRASDIHVELEDRARKLLFRPAPQVEVLKGVDFTISPGECIGIVGESGSGKTTLGRVLLRLLKPASGTIHFEERDITALPEQQLRPLRARMQMIFQNPLSSFNPRRTIGESVAVPVLATGIAEGEEAKDMALRALSRAGLTPSMYHRYPHELSGGQRQRAGIARAIVTSPKFILADEIVSGLDVSTQAQILTLLRNLQNDIGMALAFIAHDLSVVRVLCSRVMVMLAGKVVEQGATVPLFNWPRHAYTRQLIDAIPLPVVDAKWLDREVPRPAVKATAPQSSAYRLARQIGRSSMGEFIKIKSKDGGKFRAWKALPDKGSGPGIVLVPETHGINDDIKGLADRFAEEGYVVLVPDLFWRIESGVSLGYSDAEIVRGRELATRLDAKDAVGDLVATVKALRKMDELKGNTGIVGYGLGGTLALLAAARTGLDCVASYYPADIASVFKQVKRIECPAVLHLAGNDNEGKDSQDEIRHAFRKRKDAEIYLYPGAARGFAMAGREEFDKPAALMAYSRTLALLRKVLGPRYDLGHLWEMHCYHEFATRDVDAVMSTMVAEPYVNHVPAMTGGVGHNHLKRFYKYHFVDSNPEDTKLIPLSRTIGTDRVVDEMLFCFTHTREIDWMLPGIKPTGKYVEIPLVAIVCFRGEKLYSEHIYWDQASVLAQIGVLNTKGLPVAGVETAKKLLDETRPSNELMESLWKKSEGKPV